MELDLAGDGVIGVIIHIILTGLTMLDGVVTAGIIHHHIITVIPRATIIMIRTTIITTDMADTYLIMDIKPEQSIYLELEITLVEEIMVCPQEIHL
ncbi:MAG: hypothetical protein M5T52_08445 [Ignavibacteriaceae bacterium]|nr:hypothetical protein [Ignavibacteriaceae bacterium]